MLFCESNGHTTSSGGLIKNNKIFYYHQRFESLSLFSSLQGYKLYRTTIFTTLFYNIKDLLKKVVTIFIHDTYKIKSKCQTYLNRTVFCVSMIK